MRRLTMILCCFLAAFLFGSASWHVFGEPDPLPAASSFAFGALLLVVAAFLGDVFQVSPAYRRKK